MAYIEFNDAQVQAAINNLSAALTHMSPVFAEIGEFLLATTGKRFDDTEAPEGSKWAPRSPVTLAHHAREGGSFGPVLHRTGELRRFINVASDDEKVTIGTNTLHAAVQQWGAAKGSLGPTSPWGNIPARPFIGVSETDREGVLNILGGWLERVATGDV